MMFGFAGMMLMEVLFQFLISNFIFDCVSFTAFLTYEQNSLNYDNLT